MSADATVLVIEDEEPIRRAIVRALTEQGYVCATASDAAEARAILQDRAFPVVLCDVHMPGESGIDLIGAIAHTYLGTAIIMVTGETGKATVRRALEIGAYGYVVKPFTPDEIVISVMNALRRRHLEQENRTYRDNLERTVLERTGALRQALGRLVTSQEATIHRLARALEFRDVETVRHTERMSTYAGILAERAGLPKEEVDLTRLASVLHDVGKIGVPDGILLKAGPLTPDDRVSMERHPDLGRQLLSGGEGEELLARASTIAWTHHERWDGSGYPRGLEGAEIPLAGRIAAIADVFDALTSRRPYRPALELDRVLDLMGAERGTQFDPELFDLFVTDLDPVVSVMVRFPDAAAEVVGA